MINVTVRQLQIFCEAAQRLSFARVAEQLHLSPAGVSFQIKQIESATGFALFERIGKKLTLTDAGEELLVYATTVLRALDDADQAFMALRGVTGGDVKIGLVSTAKYIVPHMLTRFQASYPAMTINLREGNRRHIIDTLTRGEIDLAIMGQPPESADDVLAEPFAAHPSVLIAAPWHQLAKLTLLRPRMLADELFVVREEGSGTRALFQRFLQTADLSPRIALTSSSNETIKHAVMAGMGIALISRHTIGLEVSLGLISILAVEGFPLMRSWFVARRRSMPLLPVHWRLWTFFIEQGQSIVNDLERNNEKLGIGIAKETINRRIGARRHRSRKNRRSENRSKKKGA